MHKYFIDFQTAMSGTVLSYNGERGLLQEHIEPLIDFFRDLKCNNNKIFFIGNGGSAAIAQHMTVDYLKNGGMVTHSMHDAATLTCLGNDFGYEAVFSKQLFLAANEGDILVAISSSGRSANILNGVQVARESGCKILTLSGFGEDNSLRQQGDLNVYVPSDSYGIVESVHNMILQMVVDLIMKQDGVGME